MTVRSGLNDFSRSDLFVLSDVDNTIDDIDEAGPRRNH